jgi:hypothetical protein
MTFFTVRVDGFPREQAARKALLMATIGIRKERSFMEMQFINAIVLRILVFLFLVIRYCPHTEIDRQRWDECISRSLPGLPYAFSWYLDTISPGWDSLISGNYEAVMPLTFKRKWLITYIFKPYYAQQLGIFCPDALSDTEINQFIRSIPKKYRFVHTNLNERNGLDERLTAFKNTNYLIRIDRDYAQIVRDYSRNCRRNIKKAMDAGLTVGMVTDDRAFVQFVFDNLEPRISKMDRKQFRMLEKIIALSRDKAAGQITGVYTLQGKLCAAGFFMQTRDRQVFSVCASSVQGKEYDAMYLLVDDRIKRSAGLKTWFDFSGSNLPGIAYFNQSFGARAVTYPTLHLNRLPFPLHLIKK